MIMIIITVVSLSKILKLGMDLKGLNLYHSYNNSNNDNDNNNSRKPE